MLTHRLFRAVERLSRLDDPTDKAVRAIRRAVGGTAVERALRGTWLGHPVHPLLILAPIGAYTCAAVADFAFGDRETAHRFTGVGLLATPPAVVTGLVELSTLTDAPSRRVGLVHAAANAVASTCFLAAYVTGRRKWSVLGLAAVGAGGALGGHLSYALGAGVGREPVEGAPEVETSPTDNLPD
ncbi:DUF2231 domain-containing protein [Saccharothrix longispora]|uniref:DUF2231 domain-containing protein n=1 Tax=Saccharothrix longispora TaxID=33920 RepID=UPI0028FD4D7F|nr:DUF2231 domain-containing protein [Saccharothrix longispora]MDU0291079.1 DUF2231 domain-containing protein [Saccharothrix longispora]